MNGNTILLRVVPNTRGEVAKRHSIGFDREDRHDLVACGAYCTSGLVTEREAINKLVSKLVRDRVSLTLSDLSFEDFSGAALFAHDHSMPAEVIEALRSRAVA
ncbi:MAG: hypothetical protein R3B52_00605 [Candidatus Paceibacterota bacterium]